MVDSLERFVKRSLRDAGRLSKDFKDRLRPWRFPSRFDKCFVILRNTVHVLSFMEHSPLLCGKIIEESLLDSPVETYKSVNRDIFFLPLDSISVD